MHLNVKKFFTIILDPKIQVENGSEFHSLKQQNKQTKFVKMVQKQYE